MLIVEEAMHTSGYEACGKSLYFLLQFCEYETALLSIISIRSRKEEEKKSKVNFLNLFLLVEINSNKEAKS